MCGSGSQQTTTQVALPNPAAMEAYNKAMSSVNQVASQPFQKYSSDPNAYVSPINRTQSGAISNITGMYGMTNPYFQGATGLTMAGASPVGPLTGQQIQQYMNPYMSQVVDPVKSAMGQQFGQQLSQQQADAIKSGAFGGSRSDVARALLQGQQGLALGQALSPLYQTGYGQALQTAQGQQGVQAANLQRLLGAGQQLGGLGSAAQQAALQQAQAQLQGGTLEQQTGTAGLQALYNEFQKQRMWPVQMAQLQAQSAAAMGPLMGSSQTSYSPQPFFGGIFAHGGSVDGYNEGLGRARMGGAVEEAGDYARGGYAYGGIGAHLQYTDPSDPNAIQRRQMDNLLASQQATLSGLDTSGTEFPTADIRPGRLLEPTGGAPAARSSGLKPSTLMDVAQRGIAAKQAYDTPGTDKWDIAKAILKGDFTSPKADGGEVSDDPMQDIMNKPIQASQMLKPSEAPKQEKSGLGGLLKAGAGLAANYFLPGSGPLVSAGLGAMGMADGGRAGYATDGSVEGDDIFDRGILGAESARRQFDKYGRTLTSPKGAEGISQIMPGTAPEAAKLAGLPYDPQRVKSDEKYNEALGRAYYDEQLRKFGTPQLAAAAYNAGPGRVQQALRRAEATGQDVMSLLPAETRAYVPKVMGLSGQGGGLGAARSELAESRRAIPLGDPRREMIAEYPDRPTTESTGPQAGLGSAQVKDKSFMERTQEHPESLILPVLQGLGAMAGSRSRYLGSAIMEGLGAGAGSYMDMAAKQSEIDKRLQERATEAEETQARSNLAKKILSEKGEIDVRTAKGAITRDESGNPVDAIVFDENGRSHWMPFTQIMENPAAYNLSPEVAREVQMRQQGGGNQSSINPPPQPLQLPAPPKIPVGVGWGGKESEDAARSEYASYVSSLNKGQLKDTSNKYIAKVKDAAAAAEEDRFFTNQIAKVIGEASQQKGPSAPGAGAQWRSNLVGSLNTIIRSIPGLENAGDIFGDISKQSEILQKIHQLRGMQQVGSAQERSLGALERQINAMPNLFQDPKASASNIASQIVQGRRSLDQLDHLNAYTSRSRGLANNAESDFLKNNRVEKIAPVKKAIETMLVDPGGYIDPKDPSKGYIPPGWKVYESLESGQIDSKTVEEYFKRLAMKSKGTENSFAYSPGISRFFGEPIYGE